MPPPVNRQITLASRPHGDPGPEHFKLVEMPIPALGPGEMLLKTQWLSLDPYMRGRMDEGESYAKPVEVGGVMVGGTVSRVVASNIDHYRAGDIVLAYGGWQDYSISNGEGVVPLDPAKAPVQTALGVLGMPGMTAYVGLRNIGLPQPGETLVVAAATGPVGSMVGQIGRIKGCRVVGIAGGMDKARFLTEELGFNVGLDHRAPDLAAQLQAACPKGIDVYFENVAGKVWEAVLPLLNDFARVPVCGLIANYSLTGLPEGPDRSVSLMNTILAKRLRLQGFIYWDFNEQSEDFRTEVGAWLREGRIKYREDIVEGLENAPEAFMGLLKGRNFGKLLVKVVAAG